MVGQDLSHRDLGVASRGAVWMDFFRSKFCISGAESGDCVSPIYFSLSMVLRAHVRYAKEQFEREDLKDTTEEERESLGRAS
jgi:hypothetical protein